MEQNLNAMLATIFGKDEHFRGSVLDAEKAEQFTALCSHAEAVGRALHTSVHTEGMEQQARCATVWLRIPLPVCILNDAVRGHLAYLFAHADSAGFEMLDGALRVSFCVANVWKE